MNACDAMLMMSLREGSPNVVKEAMACNLPVVAVPVGDVAELLDGVTGNHVCSYEADELGDALSLVLTSGVASTGREAMIAKGLDLDGVAQKVINIYKSVLGDTSSSEDTREATAETPSRCLSHQD
jgi:glycosyltransferase involved in cell wall biosynthesis